jgi:competence protein ComEC
MGLCLIYDIALIFSFENIYPENTEISATCEIISLKEEKEYKNKYEVKVLNCEEIKYSKNTRLIIYADKKYNFSPGDIVNIEGEFEKAEESRNYKGFNYRNYLKQSKIYGIVYIEKMNKVKNKIDYYYILGLVKEKLYNKSQDLYEEKYNGFINGILFGDDSKLDDEVKENFRNASISHILAISGLHITYIILGVNAIIERLIKNKKLQDSILIIFMINFFLFTGSSVSCLRACFMNSLVILSSNLHRKNNFYISFFISFIVIIIINPFNLFNVGMWLSFMGTLGIALFHNFFINILKHKIRKHKLKNIFINNFFISISSQILIFPIILYTFNTVSLNFFIANILVAFFIDKILILGYLSILCSFFSINFSKIISKINQFMISYVFKIADFCGNMPLSKIYLKTPNLFFIITYYIVILFLVILFKNRRMYFLKLICSYNFLKIQITKLYKYAKVFFKKYRKISIIIFILICILFEVIHIANSNLKIYFVDVGQGDCTVIQTPKGKNIIIDGGEGNSEKYDYGKNVVLPYLLDRKINQIDYLIISHCDSDHIGGLFYILENIKVKNIVIGKQFENTHNLQELFKIVKDKNINLNIVEIGNRINIENNVYIDILWPSSSEAIKENPINNNSLVCKFYCENFSILFTGDIEKETEDILVSKYGNSNILKSTILKVAHHGSKSSSTEKFLKLVEPQIGLIGVGKNNKYGHPNRDVIERLKKLNCKIYRTDENGEIMIIKKLGIIKIKVMHTTNR